MTCLFDVRPVPASNSQCCPNPHSLPEAGARSASSPRYHAHRLHHPHHHLQIMIARWSVPRASCLAVPGRPARRLWLGARHGAVDTASATAAPTNSTSAQLSARSACLTPGGQALRAPSMIRAYRNPYDSGHVNAERSPEPNAAPADARGSRQRAAKCMVNR